MAGRFGVSMIEPMVCRSLSTEPIRQWLRKFTMYPAHMPIDATSSNQTLIERGAGMTTIWDRYWSFTAKICRFTASIKV